MEQPRTVTDPQIPGWTVYHLQEGYRAVADHDKALVVEHLEFAVLERVCAAIARPPARIAPLGGINV